MEFFPPRTEQAQKTFGTLIDNLAAMKPDYMSMTFGAGGSTTDGSYQAVKEIMVDKKQPAVAYIAGYGLSPDEILQALNHYQELGVETIFVVRGDMPQAENFTPHPESFAHASDLIAFIKKNFDFTLGCAGYPEGHVEAKSPDRDIDFLKRKIDNGAEYVVSQYFYDNRFYFEFVEKCRNKGITVPIVPGIMPVYTLKMTANLSKVCGSTITEDLQKKMDAVDAEDSNAVLDLGIDFSFAQCRGLLEQGVPGLHFYTMNRAKSTIEILNRLRSEKLL